MFQKLETQNRKNESSDFLFLWWELEKNKYMILTTYTISFIINIILEK